VVVGEGAAPSRHANLAFTRVYKTPPHGWCYPPYCRVVLEARVACEQVYQCELAAPSPSMRRPADVKAHIHFLLSVSLFPFS